MTLSLIVAVSSNNVIGRNNAIPWLLKDDLKHFSKLTKKHTVVMGRNTFLSILKKNGKPLADRKNIVLSSVPIPEYVLHKNALVCDSWEKVFEAVKRDNEVFIIGGASVYKESIKYADKLYLTRVNANIDGDAYFNDFDEREWVLVSKQSQLADKRNEYSYDFLEYSKKQNKKAVYMANARNNEQFKVMNKIAEAGVCPFCPGNFKKYHKEKILKKGKYWMLTYNQWPYENTKLHLLAVYKNHAEHFRQLKPEAGKELFEVFSWACKKFKVDFGGLAMRFGDPRYTGGTVAHIHVQFIQPDHDKAGFQPASFKIG